MSDRTGIVACSTLYAAVTAIAPSVPVRFVSQALHEYPSNPPNDDAITAAVQAAIDDLDTPERSHIAVAYSRTNHGIAEVQARTTPLSVMTADDCIDVLRDRDDPKADGTYYLTRGVIDRGIDARKLHEAYRGELDALIAAFETAQTTVDGLVADWHEHERFGTLAEAPADSIDRFFEGLLGPFTEVALVDSGTLTPFHREYARALGQLIDRYGDTAAAGAVRTVAGTHRRLEALLTDEVDPSLATTVSPGARVGER